MVFVTVPLIAGVAGTTALAAYINAKYHIAYDMKNARSPLTPSPEFLNFFNDRITRKRVLTYHILEEQTQKQPNHPFLIFEGRTWTYKQFLDSVHRVGNWLMNDLGIGVEEVVALNGGNSPEYLMMWLALDAIGAVISFINWNLTGTGLVHCTKVVTHP